MNSKENWANEGTTWTKQKRKRTRKRKNDPPNEKQDERIAERPSNKWKISYKYGITRGLNKTDKFLSRGNVYHYFLFLCNP